MFRVTRQKQSTYVHINSSGKKLAAVVIVKPEQTRLDVELKPTGTVTGRLLSDETKSAWPNKKIHYGINVPGEDNRTWSTRFGGSTMTDDAGRFKIEGLVGGWDYSVNLGTTDDGMYHSLPDFSVEPGETKDLGDVQAPPAPKRYVPQTLEERIAAAFAIEGSLAERFDKALKSIQLVNQHLLIVFGQPENPLIHRLMEIRYEEQDFYEVRDEFLLMAIPTAGDGKKLAGELAMKVDESLDNDRDQFLLVVLNAEGEKVDAADAGELSTEGELSKEKLIEWLRSHKPEFPAARSVLDDALRRATDEDKRVIVQETATWCGPCHMLSRFLKENPIWEEDYILVKMDHRLPGAQELMKEMRDGAQGGIPWFVILDADGTKLATSNEPESGDNIGYPSSESGQDHFAKMLNQTRQRLTEKQVNDLVSKLSGDGKDAK